LRRLESTLEDLDVDVLVMLANAGVASIRAAEERPLLTLHSGPAGGVAGPPGGVGGRRVTAAAAPSRRSPTRSRCWATSARSSSGAERSSSIRRAPMKPW